MTTSVDQSPTPPPCGILLIDKPLGPSSMGMCRLVRGKLKAGGAPKKIKVGHGGTLDPLASGLVVVLVGKATPLCNAIMVGEKWYDTEIDLAHRSVTDDMEGELESVDIKAVPMLEQVQDACRSFTGIIEQIPPAYSAIKVNGKRAYAMARAGETPELSARPVHIHGIEIVSYDWPKLTITVHCGKGTYIRSLARDLGTALGVGGVLSALRRTRIGQFSVDNACTPEALSDPMSQADLLPIPDHLL
jgi:tRNA pseudouridine55 synthase